MSLWVFGYGSLIWSPEFTPQAQVPARLEGWARRFCIRSLHYRGSVAAPGLVLGLDRAEGQSCTGLALEVPEGQEAEVLSRLRARELARPAYLERFLSLDLADGRQVEAVTYIVNPDDPSHCALPLAEQAAMIARACGEKGPNAAYLTATLAQLRAWKIEDPEMVALARYVEALAG